MGDLRWAGGGRGQRQLLTDTPELQYSAAAAEAFAYRRFGPDHALQRRVLQVRSTPPHKSISRAQLSTRTWRVIPDRFVPLFQ